MTSRAVPVIVLVATIGLSSAVGARARAEEGNSSALAAAMKNATATLQGGLKASEAQGTPISAKFEIEDGGLSYPAPTGDPAASAGTGLPSASSPSHSPVLPS